MMIDLKLFFNSALKQIFSMQQRHISTCNSLFKEHRKNKRQNIVVKDDTLPQEKTFDIEPSWIKKCDFPDETTHDTLFNGVRFADLPIIYIRVSKNNTIFMLGDGKGQALATRSCGVEGFKNAKKGTNIAAQATAISLSMKAKQKGVSQVRVSIRGLGPGRMASIKGLEMGGMDIVSVTDTTQGAVSGPRPRKQRRI